MFPFGNVPQIMSGLSDLYNLRKSLFKKWLGVACGNERKHFSFTPSG